ncbi:O-methyltransferase [Dichotomocladium elegans]|nr:O-methyltransferase [Dichotomocladium elegans]
MMISIHQAQFLSQLMRIAGARRILEIGTLTGYSAVAMGSVLPADGKLVTLEIDPEAHAIASRYVKMAKLEDKVELRLGPAADSIQQIAKENPSTQFDFIFLDADKESYGTYMDMILENNLLSDSGVIVADNVLRGGQVIRYVGTAEDKGPGSDDKLHIDRYAGHLHAFNVKLQQDPRISVTVLPLFDGLSIIRKK